MRYVRLRLEFGVKLDGYEPRVVGYFDDFNQVALWIDPRDAQAGSFELGSVLIVKFVAMAVAFHDLGIAVGMVTVAIFL